MTDAEREEMAKLSAAESEAAGEAHPPPPPPPPGTAANVRAYMASATFAAWLRARGVEGAAWAAAGSTTQSYGPPSLYSFAGAAATAGVSACSPYPSAVTYASSSASVSHSTRKGVTGGK